MRRIQLVLFLVLFRLTSNAHAQRSLFARFSLGAGMMHESATIKGSGTTLPAKNHEIGWRLNDSYDLFISDFGGLIKKKIRQYEYINLDALGLGVTCNRPGNKSFSLAGAYGRVSLAKTWREATGDFAGDGFAINMSADKKWALGKGFSIGVGPQAFFFNTKHYQFISVSMNFLLQFRLVLSAS